MGLDQKLLETGLPLAPYLPEIREKLLLNGAAVVRADPGSGKSTLLPLALLEGTEGKITVLEPRRAAALGIAARMAELLGEKVGERVGYAVRLERKVSDKTRIEVLTEGLFIRRLQADPSLPGISTVIFDEFHERSAMEDLALAFLLDLRRMGSQVNITIMSATLDTDVVAAFINRVEGRAKEREVPVFDVPGRVFPVETGYRSLAGKGPLGIETGEALIKILLKETPDSALDTQDTLVFLPGRREIADTEKTIFAWEGAAGFDILPLHGSLPLSRQREIIIPNREGSRHNNGGQKRRIILSTNIAESALTIPGINLVVDSGYVRLERFHVPTAMNRLSLEEASLSSAEQRAGRAGRLGPGRCIRLWDPAGVRPQVTDPEINRIDLSGLVLECLLWGIRSRDGLPWLDPPPDTAWGRAVELLINLGAADSSMNPTDAGKEIARLGLDPRLGMLCLAGKNAGCPGLACAAAAALSDRDGSRISGDGDFRSRLAILRQTRIPFNSWIRNVTEIRDDLLRRLYLPAGAKKGWSVEEEAGIGELLAAAFPDRIAGRQEAEGGISASRFRFVSGREARIEGPLEKSPWLVAAEVDAGERSAFIRLGAPVSEKTALRILERQAVSEIRVEWKGLVPKTIVRRRAGRLSLGEERRVSSRQEAGDDLVRLLQEKGLGILPWADGKAAARRLLERIRFFAVHNSASTASSNSPDKWTEEALIREAAEWLIPFINDPNERDDGCILAFASLKNALQNRFGWDPASLLDREVPELFSLPAGRPRQIEYGSGEPVISVRLQDCFGISVHPRIMGIPIVFHLLSPANRPVQISSDLPGFWKGSYAEVRKEMKGRYPKHFWPEDTGQIIIH